MKADMMPPSTRPGGRAGMFVVAGVIAALGLSACGEASGREPTVTVVGGNAERGKVALSTYGCGSCHAIPGIRTARGTVGPPLFFWSKRTYIAGEVPNTPDDLVRWIKVPQSIEPGTAMPNLGVSDASARDIAAYLYTLR
jgi:cytochrome c1